MAEQLAEASVAEGPLGQVAPDEPPDQAARERIASDLATTLVVDAGAGSGKTTALVGRLVTLVTSGEVDLSRVAAITFTEKAALELRDRIRSELEAVTVREDGSAEADRARRALGALDGAAIGTLHAFAQRILRAHAIEARLPPRLEVLDEVSSGTAFDQRWSTFQDQLLADPAMERTLLLFFAAGVRPLALRALARAFEDNWDLVEARVSETSPEPPPIRGLLAPALAAARALAAEPCADPADRLCQRIEAVVGHLASLDAIDDEVALVEALGPDGQPQMPSCRAGNLGKAASWRDVTAVRAGLRAVGDQVAAVREQVATACARRIGSALRGFTLAAAHERRASGQLQFHDLLVLARSLLCDPRHGPAIRERLHHRYQRLLLDELQDTDPIQMELAVRIAAADPTAEGTGSLPWEQVPIAPGHLFLVGDPKQSIYRFRRADVATFLTAASRLGGQAGTVELTANFRSAPPVIDWVNATFGALLAEPDDVAVPTPSQPAYLPLQATRPEPPVGPAVSVLGRHPHPRGTSADDMRAAEAAEVAVCVARAVTEGWQVDDGRGGWRPATLGDIAVLVPARTSLPFLEAALDEAGLSYRAESSSLVYASRPVRDLLMVLRAADDPTNHLHVLSALRTPLLGCGDDDLFRFRRERGGHWSYLAGQPDAVPPDDPVRAGLDYLRSLHDARPWSAPSELLDRVVRERRALELGFADGRPRDTWRRLRYVVDQARAWHDATGGNLRQYLAWVVEQAAEGARVAQAVLPETDDDAVRIMTIHAAKGLEFPITVVSGMSTRPAQQRGPAEVVFPPSGGVGYRFGGKVTTEEYESWRPVDEQMGLHERVRLLYVASTRARDHLVVSLHRADRDRPAEGASRTNAELLVAGMGERLGQLPDAAGARPASRPAARDRPAPPPPFPTWLAERTATLRQAALPGTVAATALSDEGIPDRGGEPGAGSPRLDLGGDPGLQKRPRDLDLPPWLKGRYGSAIGRAVHGVLQVVDLASGDGLDAAVAAQCQAEAVVGRAGDVRQLALAALGAPSVREASRRPHWREVYVCTPVGGRLLEGYVDLLYRSATGLVVVDYKTAGTADPAELDHRLASYRIQGASYALAVAAATGDAVVRVAFLFLTPDGAVERDLPDLDRAVRETTELVRTGREVVTS